MKIREIERKFLVTSGAWRSAANPERCRQGYILSGPPTSVRVRTIGPRAYLTIKCAPPTAQADSAPIERTEFEYEIPLDEANALLDTACTALIDKTRHYLRLQDHLWEIDEFHGPNQGLIVAEIELDSPDAPFRRPDWLGQEVSTDPRYLNVNLARHPYANWPSQSPSAAP